MQRIYFCSGSTFFTGDDIAAALLEYARVLGQVHVFDVVDLPMRRADGRDGRVSLLIGPVSQISAETIGPGFGEVVDEAVVERLRTSAARLRDGALTTAPDAAFAEAMLALD